MFSKQVQKLVQVAGAQSAITPISCALSLFIRKMYSFSLQVYNLDTDARTLGGVSAMGSKIDLRSATIQTSSCLSFSWTELP